MLKSVIGIYHLVINPFEDDLLLAGTASVASEDFASWASTSETIVVEALRAPGFEFVVKKSYMFAFRSLE